MQILSLTLEGIKPYLTYPKLSMKKVKIRGKRALLPTKYFFRKHDKTTLNVAANILVCWNVRRPTDICLLISANRSKHVHDANYYQISFRIIKSGTFGQNREMDCFWKQNLYDQFVHDCENRNLLSTINYRWWLL